MPVQGYNFMINFPAALEWWAAIDFRSFSANFQYIWNNYGGYHDYKYLILKNLQDCFVWPLCDGKHCIEMKIIIKMQL